MSTSSSGSGSFTKGDIDNILKKYFDYSDSEIFTRTSNELFYFFTRKLNYDSTSNYTQDVINLTLKANTKCSKILETMIQFIEQSLTKYVVDQVQLKFKYASVELREPAAADEYHHVAGGASKNGKKALTQPLLSSVTEVEAIGMPIGDSINQTDIVQLNTFLLDLAMSASRAFN